MVDSALRNVQGSDQVAGTRSCWRQRAHSQLCSSYRSMHATQLGRSHSGQLDTERPRLDHRQVLNPRRRSADSRSLLVPAPSGGGSTSGRLFAAQHSTAAASATAMATHRSSKDMLQEVTPVLHPRPSTASRIGRSPSIWYPGGRIDPASTSASLTYEQPCALQYRRVMELPLEAMQRIRDDFVQQVSLAHSRAHIS